MFNSPRTTTDGALAAKLDAGEADTDPKFYRDHKTVTADGWNGPWDMPGCVGGSRLQDLWFQVKDAYLGDYISVVIVSDGTQESDYGPEDTVVGSFGECNIRQDRDSNGWSPLDEKAAQFQTSKLIEPGLKCRIKYYAAGTTEGNRELLFDTLVHE